MRTFILSTENLGIVMTLLAEFLKDYTISFYAYAKKQTVDNISAEEADGWRPYSELELICNEENTKICKFGKMNPWEEPVNFGPLAQLGDTVIIENTDDAIQKRVVILHKEQGTRLFRKAALLVKTGIVTEQRTITPIKHGVAA